LLEYNTLKDKNLQKSAKMNLEDDLDCSMFEDSVMFEEKDSFMQPPVRSLRSFVRKRKRKVGIPGQEADNVSLCSLDLEETQNLEPDIKRKKSLSRVASLSSVFSTPRSLGKKMSKMSSAIHKSMARLPSPAGPQRTPSKASLARSASTVFGDVTGTNKSETGGRVSPGSVSLPDNQSFPSPLRRSSVCVGMNRKSSTTSLTPYKAPGPTPNKNRPTKYWSEVYVASCSKLSTQEIKLQEAIFELFNGEEDLVEDLKLVRKTYADSLIHLNILSPVEEELVFGHLKALGPVHSSFHAGLKQCQSKDGIWIEIGEVVKAWVTTVRQPYVAYCGNLQNVKTFLDKKRDEDKAFCDFLQRCLESPFSRKLDLWSYLDVPRSRLVKYPLLIKQVLKYTEEPDDLSILGTCLVQLEEAVSAVDKAMAEAKCRASIALMEFLDEDVPEAVAAAQEEILEGSLRNSRGTKVSVHLLDTVLVVGRTVSRNGAGKIIQVYKDPIPLVQLECIDLTDGEGGKQGSFHRAFSSQNTSKNAFKVSWRADDEELQEVTTHPWKTHTLMASDEHQKKQWVTAINKAIETAVNANKTVTDGGEQGPKKRKSSPLSEASGVRVSPRAKTPPVVNRALKTSRNMSTPVLLMRKNSGKLSLNRKSSAKLSSPFGGRNSGKLASPLKLTPVGRAGIFKKNKTSPNTRSCISLSGPAIKSTLSQSAMERLKTGGVKTMTTTSKDRRTSKVNLRQDENKYRGAIVMDGSLIVNRRTKSTTSMHAIIKKRRPVERKTRMLTLIDENSSARTARFADEKELRFFNKKPSKVSIRKQCSLSLIF